MNTYPNIIVNNQNTTRLIDELKKNYKEDCRTLSQKEERDLIEKLKDNREELNHQLFMHNIQAVFSAAGKYSSKTPDFDNMVQNGMLGLAEACKRFDITKGVRFLTYATPWIYKGLRKEFSKKNHDVELNSISLSEPSPLMSSCEDEQVTVMDSLEHMADPTIVTNSDTTITEISNTFKTDIISSAFECIQQENTELTATDIAIYKENVMMGESKKNICEKYNVTPQYITKLQTSISKSLKKILATKFGITSSFDFDMD